MPKETKENAPDVGRKDDRMGLYTRVMVIVVATYVVALIFLVVF